jgi:hypothetical protein
MRGLVVMENKEDLLFVKQVLSPYKFLYLGFQNFFPRQSYDIIITDKKVNLNKRKFNINSSVILLNCDKEERKGNLFMCKEISKSVVDFILEIHEKEPLEQKITSYSRYRFTEQILSKDERIFFRNDHLTNREFFQSFNNNDLLQIIDHLYHENVESFSCQFKKNYIIFVLDNTLSRFIINNYFEDIKVRNKKYRLFFKL